MTSQIVKRATLRNLVLPAVMLLALAGPPALAQNNNNGVQASGPNGMLQSKDVDDRKAMKQYLDRRETDEEYQRAIREQPSAKGSTDPWGNVRPATTTPAVKSAAKSATGTKPAKPAVKNAASATSAAPGQ